jgi:hypothetical protein
MGKALELPQAEGNVIACGLLELMIEAGHRGELIDLCPVREQSKPTFASTHDTDRYHRLSFGDSGLTFRQMTQGTHSAEKWVLKPF